MKTKPSSNQKLQSQNKTDEDILSRGIKTLQVSNPRPKGRNKTDITTTCISIDRKLLADFGVIIQRKPMFENGQRVKRSKSAVLSQLIQAYVNVNSQYLTPNSK